MPTEDQLVTKADAFNPMLTAADLMTPAPRTCSPYSTVLEAVLVFRDADCGLVPVVDAGRPVGVLTDRDVALGLLEHTDRLAAQPVEALMSRAVVTVRPDDRLGAIRDAFAGGAVRRLLVTAADGELRGVIAWSDVVPHLTERGMGALTREVLGGP